MHAMNKKDKFFMLLALSCLPLSEMAAEQVDGMAVSPITQEVLQNSVKITGKVVDVQGEPVIGATVMEKGTTNGIITDVDGNFTLNVSPNRKLQVSYVGYQTQEITIGSNRTLRITLKEDSELLDEVVVVGYGTMKKSDLTGAISSVSTETLVRGGNANAIGALQGSVAGVSILKSNNKPGGGYDIKIRGVSSISGSSAPLVVIDGIPGASLDNINPDDIEKIDILKDASSTAIYGSRATNGVVMVTTKKGSLGDPKISYSGYAGFRNYTHVPEMMSGDEYVQLAMENARALNNNNYKTLEEIFTDPSELKAAKDRNYYDWVDAITSPAFMTSHTISATGGTEKAKYTLGGGYYFEDGMQFPQEFSRYNMRAAVDLKANDYLSFGGSLYMTHSVRDTGNSSLMVDALRMRPTQHPYSLVTGEEIWKYTSNGMFNPLITNQNEFNKTKKLNILSNVYVKLTPVKGLELTSSFASNMTNDQIGQYRGVWTKALQGTAKGATNLLDKNNYTNWVWDNIVRYSWEHKIHKIDFTGVYSLQQNQDEKMRGASKDLPFNSLWYNLQGGEMTSMTSSYVQSNLMSFLGRINYTLADKYMLTASLRYDGSSKLADGNKWSLFPSVAVAWRLKEEAFMQSVDWLSNLKLRLSYGQTGNDNVSAYQTQGSISGAKYYTFGSSESIGYVPNNLRNLDLGWERTTEYNVGLDFGFFNNRISGSVEYYNRLTEDLIMNKTVPVTTGYSSVKANVGSVRNEGFEVNINSDNIRTKDFSWRTSLNFAYNKNKIVDLQYKENLTSRGLSLAGMSGDYSNLWIIGQPIDINYNLMTLGVWQLDEAEEAAKYGCKPGQYKPLDLNEDGVIDDKDRVIDGKRTPDWTGGMTNTFTYKEFDLSFQAAFQAGARARNQFYVSYALENNNLNFNNLRKDYWTPENPTNASAQPSNMGTYRSKAGSWGNAKSEMSHTMFSSNFLKISYITLGYTFKPSVLEKMKLGNLRLYATVQNPFIFCAKDVVDPEQLNVSINTSDAMTRNVIFGINLSFK